MSSVRSSVSSAFCSASSVQRVCIIGAGAAGLAALQVFKNEFGFEKVACFERKTTVGGAWAYAKQDNPMYDSLRTNLPKEIMAFSKNFPFRSDLPSFLHHTDVQDYLLSFAEDANLHHSIRFSTTVTSANFVYCLEEKKFVWKIKYQNTSNDDDGNDDNEQIMCEENYDGLIIANGHFHSPNIPLIPGQSNFKGAISHSYDYKNPESLLQRGVKRCLVVGGKSSGTDIARELACALYSAALCESTVDPLQSKTPSGKDVDDTDDRAVHVSVRELPLAPASSTTVPSLHPYVSLLHVHPEIRCIDSEGRVEFSNGEILENVDHILLCTGYSYHFPFFTERCDGADGDGGDRKRAKADVNAGSSVSSSLHVPPDARVYEKMGTDASAVLTVTPRSVRRLYQHLLHSANPTLAFLGLPHTIVPFPLFYLQARYLASVYATSSSTCGNAQARPCLQSPSLPSLQEREAWINEHEQRLFDDIQNNGPSSGRDDNMYHNLGPRMWEYLKFLQQNSDSNPFVSEQYLASLREVYETVSSSRPKEIGFPDTYRDDTYSPPAV